MPAIPQMFAEEAEQTLAVNDGFQTWFEDSCEVGEEHKVAKPDVLTACNIKLREVNDELKRLGFAYNKGLRVDGKQQGGWTGFRLKEEEAEWLGGEVS